MSNTKRFVELVVISDTHFGTIGCRAKELNQYLKSIKPKTIVLNGDIIDMWQFNKFEDTVTDIGLRNNFDYVVCGHIHQSCIKKFETEEGSITYLNSGDWIENMTALEYHDEKWTLFQYDPVFFKEDKLDDQAYKDVKTLFSDLVADINSNLTNS